MRAASLSTAVILDVVPIQPLIHTPLVLFVLVGHDFVLGPSQELQEKPQ